MNIKNTYRIDLELGGKKIHLNFRKAHTDIPCDSCPYRNKCDQIKDPENLDNDKSTFQNYCCTMDQKLAKDLVPIPGTIEQNCRSILPKKFEKPKKVENTQVDNNNETTTKRLNSLEYYCQRIEEILLYRKREGCSFIQLGYNATTFNTGFIDDYDPIFGTVRFPFDKELGQLLRDKGHTWYVVEDIVEGDTLIIK